MVRRRFTIADTVAEGLASKIRVRVATISCLSITPSFASIPAIARRREAKSLAFMGAVSLADLVRRSGKTRRRRYSHLVSNVCGESLNGSPYMAMPLALTQEKIRDSVLR